MSYERGHYTPPFPSCSVKECGICQDHLSFIQRMLPDPTMGPPDMQSTLHHSSTLFLSHLNKTPPSPFPAATEQPKYMLERFDLYSSLSPKGHLTLLTRYTALKLEWEKPWLPPKATFTPQQKPEHSYNQQF